MKLTIGVPQYGADTLCIRDKFDRPEIEKRVCRRFEVVIGIMTNNPALIV